MASPPHWMRSWAAEACHVVYFDDLKHHFPHLLLANHHQNLPWERRRSQGYGSLLFNSAYLDRSLIEIVEKHERLGVVFP